MLNSHTFLRISRLLLYSTAVLPLVLWAGFSFPYVTIRTALFRVIIEAAAVLALLLLAQGRIKFVNLKRQYFFWIFLGLLAVESVAAILGESPLASFFGDLERMWGIFTVAHLFLFYVLARVLFGERQWRLFFHVSFVTSIGVSLFGIIQRHPEFFGIYLFGAGEGSRIMSTLGNPVYVAIYLLFNIAFALYLLMRSAPVIAREPADSAGSLGNPNHPFLPSLERRGWGRLTGLLRRPAVAGLLAMTRKGNRIQLFYFFVIIIDFYAFTLTDIRGAYLGLLSGAALAGLTYIFIGQRGRGRQALIAAFALAVIVLALGVRFRSSNIVQQTPILRRLASISIKDETVQTRFIGWNAAWQGFLQDPLTGVGMENYNILFNKYFPARYYLFAPSETYFDRAHNQFFNILAESGIVALLLYLAFPVLIGYYLIAGYRGGRLALNEFLLFGGLATAYFTHLFFVFDDFHSLFFFAAFLALLEYRYRGSTLLPDGVDITAGRKKIAPVAIAVVFIPLIFYSIAILNFNVVRAARLAGRAVLAEDINESLKFYGRAFDINLIPSENVTLGLVEYLAGLSEKKEQIQSDAGLQASVRAAFAKAKRGLEREIAKKPNDVVFYLKLGQLNNSQFLFDNDVEHLTGAISNLERALALSPGRIQIYLVLGESYVLARDDRKAIEIMEQAVALEPDFRGTYYFLGRAFLTNGQLDQAYDAIVNKGFIQRGHRPEDNTIAFVLAEELAKAGQYEKMVTTYEYLAKFDAENARVFSALAAGYVLADRLAEAVKAALKAAELDPNFRQEAEFFVQAIEEGRIEELKQAAF